MDERSTEDLYDETRESLRLVICNLTSIAERCARAGMTGDVVDVSDAARRAAKLIERVGRWVLADWDMVDKRARKERDE